MPKPRLRAPRLTAETLEDRSVPSAATYVNDNWHLFFDADNSGGLSANDLVSTANDAGPLTVYTYGAQAFGTVTTGPGISAPASVSGFATVTNAIAATDAGGTVNLLQGTFVEDVTLNKAGLQLIGAGASLTTLSGAVGGSGATIAIGASNVTVGGLTITRQGNTVADWANANLNTVGVAIQGQAISGTVIRDSALTGNRTAIDVNNSNGHTIRNNVITANHTGLIFRNQTDNITVAENAITANRTVGILFLDASSGTNAPVQSAANGTFTGNNISGNWYGQIVDRQAGGALPAAGTNLKNFSGNWLGSAAPVVTTANSAEPGYAALIPVEFGGTATAPGGQPDVAGAASANFDLSPLLASGVDTDPAEFGFQGDFAALVVTTAGAQTGTAGRIQEGVARVTVGGTVDVAPGTYTENVTVNKNLTLRSTDGRAATTIQGVSGVSALGTILVTGGTTGFTLGGANQGFTVVGIDNGLPGIENAAVYFQGGHTGARVLGNEIRANGDLGLLTEFGAGAGVSGFVIDGNVFSGQTFVGAAPASGNQFTVANVARQLVVLGSGGGAAATGTATNVAFTNNQITGTAGTAASGLGNTLVTLDVANSTVTGNTFAGTTSGFATALRVRRPGTAISGNTFDGANMTAGTALLTVANNTTPLQAIVAANTFSNGVYVDGGTDVSTSLAGGIGRAATGSTLRILAGTYVGSIDLTSAGTDKALTLSPEGTVTVDGDLTLNADDALLLDVGPGGDQLIVTGTLTLGGATVTLAGGGATAAGAALVPIDAGTVNGTFNGLNEGDVVSIGGQAFTVSYAGGNITLTALPTVTATPSAPAAVTAGGSAATPAATPAITGAMLVNGVMTVFGPGGSVLVAVPVSAGTAVFFADFNGDGNGDLLVVSPTFSYLVDGLTGRFLATVSDVNGDQLPEVFLYSPTTGALQAVILGTGERISTGAA